MKLKTVKTSVLHLTYEVSGPKHGEALILVHGWPDSPRTWDAMLPQLHKAGYRTVTPYLRGYGPSRFRTRLFGKRAMQSGQPVAYAADTLELADHLGLRRFHFVGHDWGAWAGYALAAIAPERLKSLVAISVPFQPGKPKPPSMPQAEAFWYQWLLCSKPGEQLFRDDPAGYGRAQWDAWSPEGWYTEGMFQEAAKSWQGEDFKSVVLHAYRSRWGHAQPDPRHAKFEAKMEGTSTLSVPTLLLHGSEDRCELVATTDGSEAYFDRGYQRILLEGAGHFPTREKPAETAEQILTHLRAFARAR